ncbi:hypothetical protein [Mycobacterium simulans]|uniref:hypothetical protein n=1 Tax=Mycobacterium simulans TaxID=627089 RepID=UPI0021B3AA99|nr:hypothetical protein [Mycobacterium simulans]
MHRTPPEVTQEVSVLFHQRDVNSAARQQQSKHHARGSAADDETASFAAIAEHSPILAYWFAGGGLIRWAR